LFDFTTNGQKTQFEQEEDIEILRFLEMGYDVRMVEMSPDSVSVDTELDYQKVIRILSDSINP
jgi:3-deoxy-manno-octulosonate cytidylyltransferase (CMP-KDO synthetase)